MTIPRVSPSFLPQNGGRRKSVILQYNEKNVLSPISPSRRQASAILDDSQQELVPPDFSFMRPLFQNEQSSQDFEQAFNFDSQSSNQKVSLIERRRPRFMSEEIKIEHEVEKRTLNIEEDLQPKQLPEQKPLTFKPWSFFKVPKTKKTGPLDIEQNKMPNYTKKATLSNQANLNVIEEVNEASTLALQRVDENTDQLQINTKFQEAYSKNEFIDKFYDLSMANLRNNQMCRKQTNLRQIAQMKVGYELKRQKRGVDRFIHIIRIEDRAESNIIYSFCFHLIKSKYFTSLLMLSIVANTAILTTDSYPTDIQLEANIDWANIGFSIIFICELILKMIGLGVKGYYHDSYNYFDSVVVVTTIIDLVVSLSISGSNSNTKVITSLRSFRLLRVFKLAKQWGRLQAFLQTIVQTLKDISTFSILMALFLFAYTLLALELFAFKALFDQYNNIDMENGNPIVFNFDGFFNAFRTVFVLLTNDGWSSIYYAYNRATSGTISTIYFISFLIIGQKILLNLFLANLLENFDESVIRERIIKQMKDDELLNFSPKKPGHIKSIINLIIDKFSTFFSACFNAQKVKKEASSPPKTFSRSFTFMIKESEKEMFRSTVIEELHHSEQDQPLLLEGVSLNLFSHESQLRQELFKIAISTWFKYCVIMTIVVSSVQLAIDTPLLDPQGVTSQQLHYIDIATTIVFSIEAAIKIISFGLVMNGKASYMRNPWNLLDFAIIIVSFVSLSPVAGQLRIVKMLRIVRALRIISRNDGLKVAVKALFLMIPKIASITLIMFLFFIVFGVILISFFKGIFYTCNMSQSLDNFDQTLIDSKWDCLNYGGAWLNSDYNFDNIRRTLVTLLVMSTTSGWSLIMNQCSISTSIDWASLPQNQASISWTLFFMFFMIVGNFFFLNLFTGVVVSTFNEEQDFVGGTSLMTDNQREWVENKLLIINQAPIKKIKEPIGSKIRSAFFHFHQKQWFEVAVMICIVLNSLVLTLQWYGQPDELSRATEILNYCFTGAYVLEAIIKIIALGQIYFSISWNIFDFIVVLSSIAAIIIMNVTTFYLGAAVSVIRSFKMLRVLKLIRIAKSLKMIFSTFIVSLPALINVGGLLLFLIFVYSIIGMSAFADVQRNGALNNHLNFETFGNAFITLFIMATGDNWSTIMDNYIQINSPVYLCEVGPTYSDYVANNYKTVGCGNKYTSWAFFISYYFIVDLIFVQLFIAIILQGYQKVIIRESKMFNHDTLEHFRHTWSDFDHDASGYIPVLKLAAFLFQLGEPLGLGYGASNSFNMKDEFIESLTLQTYNHSQVKGQPEEECYYFQDVLDELSFKLMIKERVKKEKDDRENNDNSIKSESFQSDPDQEYLDSKEYSMKLDNLQKSFKMERGKSKKQSKEELYKQQALQEISKLNHGKHRKISALKQIMKKQKNIKAISPNSIKVKESANMREVALSIAFNYWRKILACKQESSTAALLIEQLSKIGIINNDKNRSYQNNQSQLAPIHERKEEEHEEEESAIRIPLFNQAVISQTSVDLDQIGKAIKEQASNEQSSPLLRPSPAANMMQVFLPQIQQVDAPLIQIEEEPPLIIVGKKRPVKRRVLKKKKKVNGGSCGGTGEGFFTQEKAQNLEESKEEQEPFQQIPSRRRQLRRQGRQADDSIDIQIEGESSRVEDI